MTHFFKMGYVLAIILLVGCGGNPGGSGDINNKNQLNKRVSANRLNWSAVPREYNPSTEDVEFSWEEEKLKVLGRFHSIVSDRENLGKLIEDKFSYFEREKARRIVGI